MFLGRGAREIMATVRCVPDLVTGTAQYLLMCNATRAAAIIDPVLDYDAASGRTRTSNVTRLLELVKVPRDGARLEFRSLRPQELDAHVDYILETHCHADHITGAQALRAALGAKLVASRAVTTVQVTFKELFNLSHLATDGSQFDVLLSDGDTLRVGELELHALATPGHTRDSLTYHVPGVGLWVGDTLFAPDKGTARCDFPGGSADTLRLSIERILAFPPDTAIYLCHDYPGDARAFRYQTTVAEERVANIHLQPGTDFVELRTKRDATLQVPHLLVPAVQLNVDAGRFPPPEANGVSYIKVPINKI